MLMAAHKFSMHWMHPPFPGKGLHLGDKDATGIAKA